MEQHPTYDTAVRNLQRYLRRLYDSDRSNIIFAVPIDGIYGDATRDAVSEFQRSRNILITGVVNKLTWDAVFSEYEELIRKEDKRIFPEFFPTLPQDYETAFGERSSFISVLQFILDELRNSYDTIPEFELNGTFDGDTSLAVKEFQRIHALPVTGKVNRDTWNALAEAFNRYAV